MVSRSKKQIVVAAAGIFAVALSAYLFFAQVIIARPMQQSLSNLDCTKSPNANVAKENPNQMLFISCGGFLE